MDDKKLAQLHQLLSCPVCRGDLGLDQAGNCFRCPSCPEEYAIHDILDGCPDLYVKTTIFPHRENTALLVDTYEETDDWGEPSIVKTKHAYHVDKKVSIQEITRKGQLLYAQLYHDYTKHIILEEIERYIGHAENSSITVLELATDNGKMAPHLQENLEGYCRIDMFIQSDITIEQMRRRETYLRKHQIYPDKFENVYQLSCNGERLPFRDSSVDIIFLMEANEHFELPHQGIFEFARILKPGGICLITTPRPSSSFFFLNMVLIDKFRPYRGYAPHPWPDYAISDETFWKYIYEAELIERKRRFFNVALPFVGRVLDLLPPILVKTYFYFNIHILSRVFPFMRKAQFRVLEAPINKPKRREASNPYWTNEPEA